jgi:hypothetical protein
MRVIQLKLGFRGKPNTMAKLFQQRSNGPLKSTQIHTHLLLFIIRAILFCSRPSLRDKKSTRRDVFYEYSCVQSSTLRVPGGACSDDFQWGVRKYFRNCDWLTAAPRLHASRTTGAHGDGVSTISSRVPIGNAPVHAQMHSTLMSWHHCTLGDGRKTRRRANKNASRTE